MRLPWFPIAIAVVLLGAVAALLTSSGEVTLVLDTPNLSSLADVDGVETEVAVDPDGARYALIASGDLWLVGADGATERLTASPETESSPSWIPEGTGITFTRGPDTFVIDLETGEETLHRERATDLEWAPGGRIAFVRERALWLAESAQAEGAQFIPADLNVNTSIRSPRFSPDQQRVMYVKSFIGLRGQVWIANVNGTPPRALIADRVAENAMSAEWVDDENVVYLTDRASGIAVWYVDLVDNTLVPLTAPLMGRSLASLTLDVDANRILMPNHAIDSDIVTSTAVVVANGPLMEMDPAISPRGDLVAYTVANGDRFEVWVAAPDGTAPRYVTLGQRPRFAPNGNEIVYSNTDLDGNRDIWKVDIRTGIPVRITDDPGVDDTPDWSPDGRTILFASGFGGGLALWTIPSTGGQRLRWNDSGYAPRYSPDGSRVVFWDSGALWTANADGSDARVAASAPTPTFAAWSGEEIAYVQEGRMTEDAGGEAFSARILPVFDRLPGGGWLAAAAASETTGILEIDLTFREQ